jgi:hypothetical protein
VEAVLVKALHMVWVYDPARVQLGKQSHRYTAEKSSARLGGYERYRQRRKASGKMEKEGQLGQDSGWPDPGRNFILPKIRQQTSYQCLRLVFPADTKVEKYHART